MPDYQLLHSYVRVFVLRRCTVLYNTVFLDAYFVTNITYS